jgi:anti-sigma factor RsiW
MMCHINDERLTELALEEVAEPSAIEASHLEICPMCAERFAEEKNLTASIQAIPLIPAPMGFAQRAVEMFARATAKKLNLAPSLILGLVAVSLITSFMLWLIIANPSVFVSQMAIGVAKAAAFFRAMVLVFSRVPYASEAVTTFSGAIVLISAGLLAGLLKRAEQVK